MKEFEKKNLQFCTDSLVEAASRFAEDRSKRFTETWSSSFVRKGLETRTEVKNYQGGLNQNKTQLNPTYFRHFPFQYLVNSTYSSNRF